MTDSVKIHAYLARAGVAARLKAEELVRAGKVKVNGKVETNVATRIVPGQDVIEYNGSVIEPETEKIILLLNKPPGVVSSVRDPDGKPVVLDFVPKRYRKYRLYPVGRLDEDSEGLILLTNDGDLAYKLTHPHFEVAKTYRVRITGRLTGAELSRFRHGLRLRDGMTAPAEVEILEETDSTQTVEVVLREGRNRQIRRMMEHLNHEVLRLQRRKMGPFELGSLPKGQVKEVALPPGGVSELLRIEQRQGAPLWRQGR